MSYELCKYRLYERNNQIKCREISTEQYQDFYAPVYIIINYELCEQYYNTTIDEREIERERKAIVKYSYVQ